MSPRPRLRRRICFNPKMKYFKPAGIPLRQLEEISLAKDELEALRLKYVLDLEQVEAAEKMGVSQPTFHRILSSAIKKVADALVKGKAIKIEKGE
ncbi:MAG: DUF134 domain-containing protein [Nanoarchaeota archaeon]|nr:DUF134 domain-containing protein [Nanoarchaeota archaeon]MBU1643804.1 DUF134 domain-containing protein [Nanoarchaeota archaeon]